MMDTVWVRKRERERGVVVHCITYTHLLQLSVMRSVRMEGIVYLLIIAAVFLVLLVHNANTILMNVR